MKSPALQAFAVVFGTIVGAGVLGVPYAVAQVGLLSGALILSVVGVALTLLLLFLGEVALRSNGPQQLTGYAEHFMGAHAKHWLAAALVVNIYGALLAYVVGLGEVSVALFGGSPVLWSTVFLTIGGFLIALGITVIKYVETWLTLFILALLGIVVLASVPAISVVNLWIGQPTVPGILSAYGVALTACFGLTAVPQVRNILVDGSLSSMRRALLWGGLVPPVLYLLFAGVVVGVTGVHTTPVATVGLGEQLGGGVLIIGSVFAICAMATSFIALGLALRNVFHRDYGLPVSRATILTLGVPIVLFSAGMRDFILILSIIGVFALGLVGIMGVLVYWAARRRHDVKNITLVPVWMGRVAGTLMIGMFLLTIFSFTYEWWAG